MSKRKGNKGKRNSDQKVKLYKALFIVAILDIINKVIEIVDRLLN